ncbi:MAG: hypothetical protein LC109_12710 [Bacteroidia bacterium]|nr:hypothetical protein [Bacteroidia bacterium]
MSNEELNPAFRPTDVSSSNFRQSAEELWSLLDDIDTLGDAIKPNDYNGFIRYWEAVHRVLRKRFKHFQSDGYKLYTEEEWKAYQDRQSKMLTEAFSRHPL